MIDEVEPLHRDRCDAGLARIGAEGARLQPAGRAVGEREPWEGDQSQQHDADPDEGHVPAHMVGETGADAEDLAVGLVQIETLLHFSLLVSLV